MIQFQNLDFFYICDKNYVKIIFLPERTSNGANGFGTLPGRYAVLFIFINPVN